MTVQLRHNPHHKCGICSLYIHKSNHLMLRQHSLLVCQISGSQSMALWNLFGTHSLALSGKFLDIKSSRPYPRGLCFNKSSSWFWSSLTWENQYSCLSPINEYSKCTYVSDGKGLRLSYCVVVFKEENT